MKLLTAIASALLLSACSSPPQAPSATYAPAQSWLAEPPYVWPDSLPRYFPAEAGVNPDHIKPGDTLRSVPIARLSDCHGEYEFAAQCLKAFKAPILSPAVGAGTVYRFIWLRSFNRPALLTLEYTGASGVLRTQFLNKEPGMQVPTLDDSPEPKNGAKERQRRQKLAQKMRGDSPYLAAVALAEAPMKIIEERSVAVNSAQLQQFQQLLRQADYWRLASCEITGMFDGAYWFLEARQQSRYQVVFRHSPNENEKFRQCCDFLLNLSPARKEERY